MGKILLTGGSGYIGSAVYKQLLLDRKHSILLASRDKEPIHFSCDVFYYLGLSKSTEWSSALSEINTVVHIAGRAHILKEQEAESIKIFHTVNVEGTLQLAKQAALSGVKRFIFISSIGVNGNVNQSPFTEQDEPNPQEPYALSKWEAEKGLRKISEESDMELVVIRPPLVYGPLAPGNFRRLVGAIKKGILLPFGAIHNKRTLVGLDNLVDLIITCIDHPDATNQTFLAGDNEDVSTTQLLQKIGKALGRPVRLIPVPLILLQGGAKILGRSELAHRLLGNLQIDISKAKGLLQWSPPITLDQGIIKAVKGR